MKNSLRSSKSARTTNALDRQTLCRFCVCIAMLLMKKTGRPCLSAAKGIMEPKGRPGNLRECVERLPMRPIVASVRARSAREGSGISGVAGSEPACWRLGTSSIIADADYDRREADREGGRQVIERVQRDGTGEGRKNLIASMRPRRRVYVRV